MAFPSPVAEAEGATSASNTTTHPITLPTHAAGDLLLVLFTAAGHSTHTPSGTGWTSSTATAGFNVLRHTVFTKIATSSSETLTITTGSATQSSHISKSTRPGAGMALEWEVGPSGNGYSGNTYFGEFEPSAGLQDYLSLASVGTNGSTEFTGIGFPFSGFNSSAGAGASSASTAIGSANEASTTTSIIQFLGNPTDVDWAGFPIAVWEVTGGGGSTTITAVTSLAMAVQLARNAAASVGLAVQAPQQATTSVALAVRTAQAASTSLAAAVQQARAASTLVQLAVQAPQSSAASVATAVQVARNAAANLDLLIQRTQALGVGVDLQVQTPSAASASVSLQVQVGSTLSTALAVAVQELRQAAAAVSLAVSQARAQGADASMAVQAGRSGNVATSLAVQQARTGGASVDMQIQEGATRSAALQAAVQFAADASTSVGLAVAGMRTAGVGLAAAVSLQRALGSVVDLVVLQRQLASLGVSMHIVDSSTFARAPDGPLPQDRFANTKRPDRLPTSGRPTMSNTSRPRR